MRHPVKILPNYTYEDYCRWEGRWEIIDGIPFAMNLEYMPEHQLIATKIGAEFGIALKKDRSKGWVVSQPVDYKISENTVVQPDMLIYHGKTDKAFLDTTPKLLVEIISPTSALKDRYAKFGLYEKEGVAFFILVNPDTETVQVYMLDNSTYVLKQEGHDFTYRFEFDEDCCVDIDFNEIW
jgi:Uma2 family endonuclease